MTDEAAPEVSIGMPVFNDERNVRLALDSLLQQTHRDLELIISDNASTDGTGDVCRDYAGRDSRVRYLRQPQNRGQVANFAFVREQARGRHFMWAASDDIWHPAFVKTLLDAVRSRPHIGGAFCPYVFVDNDGQPLGDPVKAECSSSGTIARLAKFAWHYNDCFFYGLYRREVILRAPLQPWAGVNAVAPYALTIPPLATLLAATDIHWIDGPPLMFKRRKSGFRHPQPHEANPVLWYPTFVRLQGEIWTKSLKGVYQGSSSWLLTAAAAPLFGLRLGWEALRPLPGVVKWSILRGAISLLGQQGVDRLRGRGVPGSKP